MFFTKMQITNKEPGHWTIEYTNPPKWIMRLSAITWGLVISALIKYIFNL